ncbi:hypothetical protein E4U41_003417 [Claviceps citrina]|nr:hypothetical protein E4U41_003417 [Claviceps citrina]
MAPPVGVKRRPHQKGKPRGMRRDRDCQSCKTRGIKCDLNRPSCSQCLAANIKCAGYPQRVIWAADRSLSTSTSTGGASNAPTCSATDGQKPCLARLTSKATDGWSTGDTTTTSASPGVGSPVMNLPGLCETDQNSFIASLVAFCRHIISIDDMSGGHGRHISAEAVRLIAQLHDLMKARIECRSGGVPLASGRVAESIDTTRHRLATLVGLNEALEAANPFALLCIAGFAVLEVCDSPFGEWQRHLRGAKSLLDVHCPDFRSLKRLSRIVTGLGEVVARLVWFDTLGAIARGSQGLIFDDWHRQTVDPALFHVVGCSPDTFALFNWVADGRVASDAMSSCIMALEQLTKMDAGESAWMLSCHVNRCASAIAVLAQLDPKIQCAQGALASAVDRACSLIAAMSPSSMYYIHVAVAAYLAGMHASSVRHCEIIRAYWLRCNCAGARRYPDGLAKCEDRWRSNGLIRDV